ncbi:hypothetical protein ACWIUD_04750 [Helicobacter sp. 23-1044]
MKLLHKKWTKSCPAESLFRFDSQSFFRFNSQSLFRFDSKNARIFGKKCESFARFTTSHTSKGN